MRERERARMGEGEERERERLKEGFERKVCLQWSVSQIFQTSPLQIYLSYKTVNVEPCKTIRSDMPCGSVKYSLEV